MMDRLFSDAKLPLLEKMVRFASARERVLADNIANLSTPNYVPKDLSQEKFQQILRAQLETKSFGSTSADDDEVDQALNPDDTHDNILFHDRNNRSVEQLMSDHANNALMHNLMIELMRKRFSGIQMAIKERVS